MKSLLETNIMFVLYLATLFVVKYKTVQNSLDKSTNFANATENIPLEVVKTGSGFSPMPLGSVD